MRFNIKVTISDPKDLKRIAHIISEMVEKATGDRANVSIRNQAHITETKQVKTFKEINKKLLR